MKRKPVFSRAAIAWIVAVAFCSFGCEPGEQTSTFGTAELTYTGSVECGRCHAEAFAAWSGSHHDLAMQPATEQSVLGDFEDHVFEFAGERFHFFRIENRFYVNAPGADGEPADFEISYTFGVDPLQQYLIAFPGGRLQSLSASWDSRTVAEGGQRWFHVNADDPAPPGDPFHWTGLYQTWNHMCADCHSTNFEARFDSKTNRYESSWDEIDVGCEACHGPGSRHVEWVETRDDSKAGLIVDFSYNTSRDLIEACAHCHSRRHSVSSENHPGQPFLDDFMPEALREGLYYPDGQILEEVYVYGSFLQSLMYARGVRCSDCHDSHSLKLRAEGNALCIQCHNEYVNPRFPSLRAKPYDTAEHHFHKPDSPGALCVDCHMPSRIYMQNDLRHDHRFGVPRPDLSVKLGTPNACTDCHQDQSIDWAVKIAARWYPDSKRAEVPHFAEAFQAGRDGAIEAVPALISIVESADQPALVRATALELLVGLGPSGAPAVIQATRDDDPIVRASAVAALSMLPPEQRIQAAAPRLRDPLRAVRVEAARVLSPVPLDRLDEAARRDLELGLDEYTATQIARTDTPPANLNLAVLAEIRGEPERAVELYLAALAMDPDFFSARANLAILYSQLGQTAASERLLREGIARDPDQGELHYSLGLLLAEGNRFELAAGYLGRAAELLSDRARVSYNHGLALQRTDRPARAEAALTRAVELAPRDPEIVYGLIVFYTQQAQWEKARPHAQNLVELTGGNPQAVALVNRIEREMSTPSIP